MKSVNAGSRRQKIIIYYALAVVLPGIILGFLAYRGIRNDQALREKESRRRLEINSQDFISEIDTSFVQLLNELTTDSILAHTHKSHPSVLALLVVDTSGSKRLITHRLLYLPADLMTVKTDQSTDLKEGQRLEFIEHSFSEALRYYHEKIITTTNPFEKIQAMVASARLYNKMNQTELAKELYYEIRKDYPRSLLNGQIPLGLLASLEILKINKAEGEYDEMRSNSLEYLELLLHPPSEYDTDQFNMFYQSFKDNFRETDHTTDSLVAELDTQRTRTEYLIRILSGPDMITTSSKNHFKSNTNGMSIIPITSSELTAVYLSCNKNNRIKTSMVIDFPLYLKSVSGKLIKRLDQGTMINIKVEDESGKLIFSKVLKEETGYISFPFPEYLPQWKLLLSENKPGFIATLLKAGSGIYLFIFILIALLMVLGFVFIMYTLNVELRLNKLKSEFISNVSHELKSPLTSIRMMTEILHHNRVETEERKSAYYSAMLEESEHLSHLIDNILDFSKIDEGRKKYEFVSLDLDKLTRELIKSKGEMIKETGFDIRYSCPDKLPVIQADRNAILQVLYNLVDNAIKFSGKSRQIDISLFPGVDELVLCVKDYGIGISGKNQVKIFDRFYRGDEPQRMGIRGSGIGLTIVKQIIDAHRGTISIESEVGKGSAFTVRIPLS